MAKLATGDRAPSLDLTAVSGEPVRSPDPDRLVHLQFRRFAGCPICHLHLRSFVRAADRLTDAGVREIVFFHSGVDELREHVRDLPFAVIADGDKRWYRAFGVEAGARALLDPRAWPGIVRAVTAALWLLPRRKAHLPSANPSGGRLGLPADLLIGPDGTVLAAKYGTHADDQWSVEEVLTLARTAGRAVTAA
ncbi:peroxiredoxin-like family protein [Catellatospora citrea]|uniref:Alkyl hydroperoxide reductase n=1 Tax=Catellatospora citrea TaxID=53366 RepID=A0A8J3KGI1_9ACTN|nr:peroxiredoxin-like family protein [Catellatospora citrea]RKE11041.1 peroxiredoxin [Catellatospora citrea]GIF96498.1 alkyl hydroperoxide reductase [Catellatospora citrea]